MNLNKYSTEKQLQEALDFTEKAIDALTDTLFVYDPKTGKAIRWNKVFREISGYTDEEIADLKAPDSYYSPEDLHKAAATVKDVQSRGQGRVEISLICRDGKRIPTEYIVSAINDEHSNIEYIIAIGRDITLRRQKEKAQLALERNLKSLWSLVRLQDNNLKTVADFVLEEISKMSGSRYGFYGFMSEDENTMNVYAWSTVVMKECGMHDKPITFDIKNAGIWGDAVRKRKIILINNYPEPFEGKKGIPRGHLPLTRVLSVPVFSQNKIVAIGSVANKDSDYTAEDVEQLSSFLTSAQLIIDRKKTESALQKSEAMHRSIIHTAMDGFWLLSLSGNLLRVNEAYCHMTGYSEQELMDMSVYDLEAVMSRAEIEERIKKVTSQGSERFESQHYKKNGNRIDVEVSVQFQRDEERFVAFIRDITERKKLEEELQKIHKLESLGIFAGGIAHDFNNLLTGIMNNVYLSKMHMEKESKAYHHLDSAENALLRSSDLTQQLLTFSRGGAPVMKISSISEIVRDTADFTLRGSNVKCEYSISDEIWPVNVDRGQISQVIQNVIINAEQAMPEGGTIMVTIENTLSGCETEMPLKDRRFVKITIHDRGLGISDEHLQKIFDPYFTTKALGRGLGLAISHSIIQNHNGRISVDSQMGHGTIFDIYLPASDRQIPADQTTDDGGQTGEGRVLIMDDEELVRSSLEAILAHMGYEVQSACDGAEAVEIYKQAMESSQPFDAVILDLTVPGGMGGEEAIKTLRAADPKLKAIVSSGYSNNSVIANFREYGFRGILTKPYKNPAELNRIIQDVINDAKE